MSGQQELLIQQADLFQRLNAIISASSHSSLYMKLFQDIESSPLTKRFDALNRELDVYQHQIEMGQPRNVQFLVSFKSRWNKWGNCQWNVQ